MATPFKLDVSMDAVSTEHDNAPNAVSQDYRTQHRITSNMSSAEETDETTPKSIVAGNTSSEMETETILLTKFLEHEYDANGQMSFADFLLRNDEPMDLSDDDNLILPSEDENMDVLVEPSAADTDDKIHRFLLELTATHDLKWTTFLADLGYSSKDLLHVPQGKKDDNFFHYLIQWLETVTSVGQNPVQYLYRALMKSHHKDLINELKLQFPRGTQGSSSDNEFAEVKNLLQAKFTRLTRDTTRIDIMEDVMRVQRDIWSNITDHELEEIKAYLRNKKRDKFGKRVLGKIKTCVDLMDKLYETCLVQEDDFEFLKSILNFVNREDLIQKIIALEARIGIFKKDNNLLTMRREFALREGSSCGSISPREHVERESISAIERESVSAMRRESALKLTKIIKQKQKLVPMFLSSTRIIEQHITAKTQDLQKIDEKEMQLTCKSESCRQKMKECAKKKMQIEIQNRKLHSEIDFLLCSESTSGSELILIHKDKEDLKHLHQKQAIELTRLRNILKRENELLVKHKEELNQMKQELSIFVSLDVNIDPMILVMAAEENKDELESFKADVLLAVPQSVTKCSIQEIVFESFIDEQFLSKTDTQIQKAVLLFILVSGGFASRCWPDISKMKNLTAALYDQQPLVVPVIIKANVKPPIGLNSAHSLNFYRRDSYYKEALSKLLEQLKK